MVTGLFPQSSRAASVPKIGEAKCLGAIAFAPVVLLLTTSAIPIDQLARPKLPTSGGQAAPDERNANGSKINFTRAAGVEAALPKNVAQPRAAMDVSSAQPFLAKAGDSVSLGRALHCMTQAIYYEAGMEPLDGQRAVAQVVLNRVQHPAFPTSICGVIYQGANRTTGCQFTFTCDGSLKREPSRSSWATARRIAEEALAGRVFNEVGLATHYHASYVAPYWRSSLREIGRIGMHIFYGWQGVPGKPQAFTANYSGIEFIPEPSTSEDRVETVHKVQDVGRNMVLDLPKRIEVKALGIQTGGAAGSGTPSPRNFGSTVLKPRSLPIAALAQTPRAMLASDCKAAQDTADCSSAPLPSATTD